MNRNTLLLVSAIGIFVAQAISSKMLSREPFLPSPPPLVNLPMKLGSWLQVSDETVPPEALTMLGPDDYIARIYRTDQDPRQAELFVAYYKTQLRSKNAHDPKVCLPGAGWNPVASHLTRISTAHATIPVNYYRIKKSDQEQVVLYWFQTLRGVYTGEQQLKAHRVWDAIVDNRTDMALVRVIVPVTDAGIAAADASAAKLAQVVFTQMLSYFPLPEKAGS